MALTKAHNRLIAGAPVSVIDFGAKGDGVTDDLAAFNAARNAAAATSKAIYIPATQYYYRLTDTWEINVASMSIMGDGVRSMILIDNASGADAIEVTNRSCHISQIGISGVTGCGNGLHVNSSLGNHSFSDIWVGWVDGNGFQVTSSQSNIFTNCQVNQNNGYRPTGLLSGTEGTTKIAFAVDNHPTGNTNNQSFVNCMANAGGDTYNVRFGNLTSGTKLASCHWIGGLIQGSGNYKEVYITQTEDCSIISTHIEPPVGVTSNYVLDVVNSVNFQAKNTSVQGDARFTNCTSSGLSQVRGAGVLIDSASKNCYLRDMLYRNITTGPIGGEIIDRSNAAILENVLNVSNERFSWGNILSNPAKYISNNMDSWVGGVVTSPTVPCGFIKTGTAAVTVETTIKRSFSYSAKIVTSANNSGLRTRIGPIDHIQGQWVFVDAWIYVSTSGAASIRAYKNGGAAVYGVSTSLNDGWEKMRTSFFVDSDSTSFDLYITADSGVTFYIDSISISVESPYSNLIGETADGTATPSASHPPSGVGGSPVRTLLVGAGTNITSFVDPHVGQQLSLLFTGSRTVVHSAGLLLDGGTNFVGAAGDALELVYGQDGAWREIGRS